MALDKNKPVSIGSAAARADREESYDPEFEGLVTSMLERLGEDPSREGLKRTPLRVTKAMEFLTSGYRTAVEDVSTLR